MPKANRRIPELAVADDTIISIEKAERIDIGLFAVDQRTAGGGTVRTVMTTAAAMRLTIDLGRALNAPLGQTLLDLNVP
jgi:hypothetical protein